MLLSSNKSRTILLSFQSGLVLPCPSFILLCNVIVDQYIDFSSSVQHLSAPAVSSSPSSGYHKYMYIIRIFLIDHSANVFLWTGASCLHISLIRFPLVNYCYHCQEPASKSDSILTLKFESRFRRSSLLA